MARSKKDFAHHVRVMMGLHVEWLGTRPVRLRAWPRGTRWQGWYASGRSKEQAYINLVRVICDVPAFWHLNHKAQWIIREASRRARRDAEASGEKIQTDLFGI